MAELAGRVAADVTTLSSDAPSSPADVSTRAGHLGLALNPGAVALGVFVDKQAAGKVEDGIGKTGAQILTADDLKRIGAGLGARAGTNDLAAKAAAAHACRALRRAARSSTGRRSTPIRWLCRHLSTGSRTSSTRSHASSGRTWPRTRNTCRTRPVNKFWHAAEVIDATYRDGGCPNNDTAYSFAWARPLQGSCNPQPCPRFRRNATGHSS